MAVTRTEKGDQAARQAQVARAQATGARRSDALARERFSLDRQDSLRQDRLRQDHLRNDLDARNRAREATAAKARTASGGPPAAGPSQDRGTGAATGASAARPGGTAATDAAGTKPQAKAGPEPEPEDAGPAAPGRAGRSAPGTASLNSSQDERAETKTADDQIPETAMPAALAPTAPGAVPRQASAAAAAPGGGDQSAGLSKNAASAEPSHADSASEAGVHGKEAGTAALPFADALAETPATAADVSPLPPPPATVSDKTGSADKIAVSPHATPAPAPEPPVPLGAVPMTIGLRSMVGTNRFEMRLDPAELGRIDVTLDIDKDGGGVSATLVVDNPATLALLRRDSDSLQQALAQAGFSAGEAGITFQLRGDDASQGGSRGEAERQDPSRPAAAGAKPDALPLDAIPLRALRPVSGLDIRI